jgi:hypothetical protein
MERRKRILERTFRGSAGSHEATDLAASAATTNELSSLRGCPAASAWRWGASRSSRITGQALCAKLRGAVAHGLFSRAILLHRQWPIDRLLLFDLKASLGPLLNLLGREFRNGDASPKLRDHHGQLRQRKKVPKLKLELGYRGFAARELSLPLSHKKTPAFARGCLQALLQR